MAHVRGLGPGEVCASPRAHFLGFRASEMAQCRSRTLQPQQAHRLHSGFTEDRAMSLVRLLGFRTLTCGCVIGRYRELATSRELTYIEEKGHGAARSYGHRRNHTIAADRAAIAPEQLSPPPRLLIAWAAMAPTLAPGLWGGCRAVSPITIPFGDPLSPRRTPPSNFAARPFGSISATASMCSRALPEAIARRDRHVTSLQPRHPLSHLRRHDPAVALSGVDRRMGRRWRRARSPTEGSLFLNVGSKPTDPWTALDVAQAARPHLQLQNTIHWIKSIAIEKALAGARAGLERRSRRRPLQADQQRALSARLSRVRVPLHAQRRHAARPPGGRREISGQVERRALARGRPRTALPRQHVVHSLRDDPEPREGPAAPGDVPASASGDVPAAARRRSHHDRRGSVPRTRIDGRRVRAARAQLRRHRDGRGLSRRKRSRESKRSTRASRFSHRSLLCRCV